MLMLISTFMILVFEVLEVLRHKPLRHIIISVILLIHPCWIVSFSNKPRHASSDFFGCEWKNRLSRSGLISVKWWWINLWKKNITKHPMSKKHGWREKKIDIITMDEIIEKWNRIWMMILIGGFLFLKYCSFLLSI